MGPLGSDRHQADDATRGLAESLPPSSRKLFSSLGVLDAVDQAGFFRTTGNTVWWGSREGRVENFPAPDTAPGFQVFRPDLDRLLLESARDAGARVCTDATVRQVRLENKVAVVEYEDAGISSECDMPVRARLFGPRGAHRPPGFSTV